MSHAVHALNRTPMRDSERTPFEMLFGKKPDISHLRPFGAAVITWVPEPWRDHKLQPRGVPARMVDYVNGSTSMYKVQLCFPLYI